MILVPSPQVKSSLPSGFLSHANEILLHPLCRPPSALISSTTNFFASSPPLTFALLVIQVEFVKSVLPKSSSLSLNVLGTLTHPKGDSMIGACVGLTLAYLANNPLPLLLLPYSALARVWFHFHWLGDVLAGSFLGLVSFSSSRSFLSSLWKTDLTTS